MDIMDRLYFPFILKRRLFTDGWGSEQRLEALRMPQKCAFESILRPKISFLGEQQHTDATISHGTFKTTSTWQKIPSEVQTSYIEIIKPTRPLSSLKRPAVIHFAATGDDGFERRRNILALPLAKKGITSVLLQSPFYGIRKPSYQQGTSISTVLDLLLLGRLSIEEGRSLLAWLHSEGYGPLGVTGVSRGGLTAAIIAAITPLPVATASCIGCHSGAPIFTEGMIQHSCEWQVLGTNIPDPKQRMKEILSRTNLRNFPLPQRPDAAIFVSAKRDGIVPKWSSEALEPTWPGSETRWIRGGHVSSFFFHRETFRQAIIDSLSKI